MRGLAIWLAVMGSLTMSFFAIRAIAITVPRFSEPCFQWGSELTTTSGSVRAYSVSGVSRPGDPCTSGRGGTSETKAQATVRLLIVSGGILFATALGIIGAVGRKPAITIIGALLGYRDIWNVRVKARIGDVSLRDFRPADGTRLLEKIAAHAPLSRRTMYHIKSFLSGVFAHAISQGWLDSDNPMRNARVPAGLRAPVETAAYDLAAIEQILKLPELSEKAQVALAVAAFTGLRKGEIRGLRWDDYSGTELRVSRSVWHRHVTDPKTDRAKAPVPIIPRLSCMLDAFKRGRTTRYIFEARSGRPLDLDNLARREIVPMLAVNQIAWLGWHTFRRGLATNLHRLGVDDKTIQSILRHSSLATTQAIYIKVVQADVQAAMQRLESALPAAKLPSLLVPQ